MKKLLLITLLFALLLVSCSSDSDALTLEKFNQLENGMTYEEAIEIIGFEGTLSVESGEKGTDLYTVMYMYSEDQVKGSLGANANFMFQGNILKTKAQISLK